MGLFTPRRTGQVATGIAAYQGRGQFANRDVLRSSIRQRPASQALSLVFLLIAAPLVQADSPTAETATAVVGPILDGDRLIFPEGADISRALTDVERAYLEKFPPVTPRAMTPPPTGPVRPVAEYEPMEGALLSWRGSVAQNNVLAQMARWITTTGDANVYLMVSVASQSSALTTISNAGANMARVFPLNGTTDTIWIRDYGPRYVYIGQVRAIVDHIYNRPRPNDDVQPTYFANYKKHAYYEHILRHGGGNYHLDKNHNGYATELIWNENTNLTHPEIHDIWYDYQNIDTHIFPPFPTSVDLTQHLDMWMQVFDDDKVMISDWPNNVGSTQDVICDNAAVFMANRGYTVFRVPARLISGVHYTYTNVVLCNDLVMVPSYTNATVSPHNAPAMAAWQAAMPGKTVVQVASQALVTSAGVLHCVMMHVPKNLGGVNPTAYLQNYRGGEVLTPSQQIQISWISDDDVGTVNADILLSTDDGQNYDTLIAGAVPDNGSYTWTVPDIYTTRARIRVLVRDAIMKTGEDQSDSNLTINGAALAGDVNCDVKVDLDDVSPFVTALLTPALFTECNLNAADMNGDTLVDSLDVAGFIEALLTP